MSRLNRRPGSDGLYGFDVARVMYGEHAREAPAWMYVQHQGDGLVSFVGASHIDGTGDRHPLRYGSDRTHLFLVGSIITRPSQLILATDTRRGEGLPGLATGGHDIADMLTDGEIIAGRWDGS